MKYLVSLLLVAVVAVAMDQTHPAQKPPAELDPNNGPSIKFTESVFDFDWPCLANSSPSIRSQNLKSAIKN